MPANRAAWLPAKLVTVLDVNSAPYTSPLGDLMFGWLKYPFILGFDVAGEVVEVGKGVSRFQVGDRVLGYAVGSDEKINRSAEGGFQDYVVLRCDLASHIPSSMSYESASVIPLGLSTAACGLFQKDQLALQQPTVPVKPTGKTLLIWGGSTSVGCNAIQLAVAAGYDVITTASPKNFEYLKKLGAGKVFDYKSKTVVKDIINELKGKTCAGAFSIGAGAAEACMEILDKSHGNKFVALATYPSPPENAKHFVLLQTAFGFISWVVSYKLRGLLKGVGSAFIFGSTLAHNGVGKDIFVDFLPGALERGTFVAAPDPRVVGKGLESLQVAFEIQMKGVSATKIVVSI